MKKYSLIGFTILSQMAVGAFWILIAATMYSESQIVNKPTWDFPLIPLIVIEATMMLSLLLSLAHLGSPLIAYRAIANFRSSWLSREIIFAGLFTMTIGVFSILQWSNTGSANLQMGIALAAGGCGFGLVFSMSRIYMLRTVPVWNTIFTPISFFVTALTLGGLLISGLIMVFQEAGSPLYSAQCADVLAPLTTSVLLLIGTGIVFAPARVKHMFSSPLGESEALKSLLKKRRNNFYLRILLGILGAVFLGFSLLSSSFMFVLFLIGALFVLVAELIDRFLFYEARETSGI